MHVLKKGEDGKAYMAQGAYLRQLTFIELKFDIVEQGASGPSPSGA